MSIHSSLCPHAHWAMYFCDMIWVSVSFAAIVGTMRGSARNAAFSAAVICVGDCDRSSAVARVHEIDVRRDAVRVRRERRRLVAHPVRRFGLHELQLRVRHERNLRLVVEDVAARQLRRRRVPA